MLGQKIVQQLEATEYVVDTDIINSSKYVPQRRERWYMVAIRKQWARSTASVFSGDPLVQPRIGDFDPPLHKFIADSPDDSFNIIPLSIVTSSVSD